VAAIFRAGVRPSEDDGEGGEEEVCYTTRYAL